MERFGHKAKNLIQGYNFAEDRIYIYRQDNVEALFSIQFNDLLVNSPTVNPSKEWQSRRIIKRLRLISSNWIIFQVPCIQSTGSKTYPTRLI